MFREMRRSAQALAPEVCSEILAAGSRGVLAVCGDEGYPYAVPLSYAYADGRIYFHCAPEGHKLDAIRRDDRVSFCVIAQDDVSPAEYTTNYRSVIAFGRAHRIEDADGKRRALMALGRKYAPGQDAQTARVADGALDRVAIVEIEIEHLSGKESRRLAERRRAEESK